MEFFLDKICEHLKNFFGQKIKFPRLNVGNLIAINLTTLFFGTIFYICLFNTAPERVWLNLLISLLGGLIGWLLGNIASPINQNEQQTFSELAKVIVTFFSGYLVSKLDRFVENVLFTDNTIKSVSWISLCFFSSALILTSVTVFLNRTYSLKQIHKHSFTEALKFNYFEEFLTVKLDSSQALNNKGLILEQLGERDKAIETFQEALKIDSQFQEAQENLNRLQSIK